MILAGETAKRALRLVIFAVVAASLVTGAYLFLARFLADRQSAMNNDRRAQTLRQRVAARDAARRAVQNNDRRAPSGPTTSGQPNPGEAAIQRQLRALEEINKINEMNRRLQEQQRRMHHDR